MTFKFEGKRCAVKNGVLECPDELPAILAPLLKVASGSPHEGDPFFNLLLRVYGKELVTDFEDDDCDPYLIN
jgi:hypothetical protein